MPQIQQPHYASLVRLTTGFSVGVGILVLSLKGIGYWQTGSLSLQAAFLDSFLDLLSSVVNFWAVRFALIPSDDEHQFGHAKIEPLASLGQSCFIAGAALWLFCHMIERFFNPLPLEGLDQGLWFLLMASIVTFVLLLFQRYAIRKTGNTVIKADYLHYMVDLCVNLSVFVSLFLVRWFGWVWADAVFGVLISVYMLKGAWSIGYHAFHVLLDRELPLEEQQNIRQLILLATSQPILIQELRTRSAGNHLFIQCKLKLSGSLTLDNVSDLLLQLEKTLKKNYPTADVILQPLVL